MFGRLAPFALIVLVALAGCAAPDALTAASTDDVLATPASAPYATVALVDTGLNPYHVDFRDETPLAYVHPSTYLPGYPADAIAVNLTFDAEDLEAALEADKEVWKSLEPGKLYWFPGTKVSGISFYGADALLDSDPGFVFSSGHGTMTASRAAGNGYSLCPECRIVAVQGFTAESVTWASEQTWIDAQSNSWSPAVVFQQADPAQSPGLADAFEAAATRHAVFGSAGNGVAGKFGVVGHPSFTRSTSGPHGVVAVGGHDNGELILWSGSWPHVVADACSNWAAVGDTLDEYSGSEGGGTSSASPYAAGEAARLVLEARILLSQANGTKDAVFVTGGAATEALGESPLADGDLTYDELKTVLFKTAIARPTKTEHDGESCGMTGAPYNTYPVAWSAVPADVPTYALIGYGQVSVDSLAAALDVLRGVAPLPERPVEDEWHAYAETLRETYNGLPAR